ncbi:hypothetical protein Tco_1440206, partial [Tanacetum coccineum]
DTYPILLSSTHCGNKSILRVLRIILVILPEHPSETKVLHNEDGNPARANIKQALGRLVPSCFAIFTFEPLTLSLTSMPSCDLESLTNILILCLILKASDQSLRKSLSLNLELS